jgi:hypothetical protein
MLHTDYQFQASFCKSSTDVCLGLLKRASSFNLIAMPGVGVTYFLRHLEQQSDSRFIYINSYEMPEFSRDALLAQIAMKLRLDNKQATIASIGEALNQQAKDEGIVLVFNRFDRLGSALTEELYENLRFLRNVDLSNIAMIFVTGQPITEIARGDMQSLVGAVSAITYFPAYSEAAMTEIAHATGLDAIDEQALLLCGGNHSLFQILLRCQNVENALADPMVELLLAGLYSGMSAKRQKILASAAQNKSYEYDPYLEGVGYLNEGKIAMPLLQTYIQRTQKNHLPAKEKRLFDLLHKNSGQVVSKERIFDMLWPEDNGIASEWALNALVYRLRKHPAFDATRYSIQSRKKQGYILFDNHVQPKA